MSESPARDVLDEEPLDPSERTLQRRRARDEQLFRTWCEESHGPVTLGGETFHPADVLDKLAPETARRGRADALDQAIQDIERTACDRFPAIVAIPFQRFLEGNREPLTRLHRLRDTWESLVRLLAALALSEAAAAGSRLAPLKFRESASQALRDCKRRDLYSEKLAVRIGITEAVLLRANEVGLHLELSTILPLDVIAEVRRLNSIRNGFSHEATKSDKQAEGIIGDAYPAVREMLLDLQDLQEVRLFRVRRTKPAAPHPIAEIERLDGNSLNQRITDLPVDPEVSGVIMAASRVGMLDRVLARIGHKVVDISPFVYATDDATGHRTRLLEFKYKRDAQWHLECVGDSSTEGFEEGQHLALLARLYGLLSNNPGDGSP